MGCEAAIHATRSFAEAGCQNGSHDVVVKLDLQNAFNSLERDTILSKIQEHTPTLYPFLNQCYAKPSQLFHGPVPILSQVGAQQGDPLGPLIFSLAIHDIVMQLRSKLNIWYLYDGTIGGSVDAVTNDVKKIVELFKELGLGVNSEKCEVFCCDQNEDISILRAVIPGLKTVDKTNFTLLGAPIFPEAIPRILDAKKLDIVKSQERLKNLSAHVALTLFRSCLSMPKLTYTLRTSPIWLYPVEAQELDDTIRYTLEELLNVSLDDNQWQQAALPIRHGGLGIRQIRDTGLPAFLASAHGVVELVTRILSIDGDGFCLPFVTDALAEWDTQRPRLGTSDNPAVQRNWDDINSVGILNRLMAASSGADLARLRAASTSESGAWLHALPSPQMGTLLDNDSLRIAVALRLGCNICEQHQCICGAQVDIKGYHGLSCQRCAGRFPRHHALNEIIRRAMVTANIPCVLEPPGLSRSDGKRPDGLTLVPWERGRSLLWDATCVSTFAATHLQGTTRSAGSAAESAARQKHAKYEALKSCYTFVPVAFETSGVWGSEARTLLKTLGRRIVSRGYDPRSGSYLAQRISIAIQRGNSIQ